MSPEEIIISQLFKVSFQIKIGLDEKLAMSRTFTVLVLTATNILGKLLGAKLLNICPNLS